MFQEMKTNMATIQVAIAGLTLIVEELMEDAEEVDEEDMAEMIFPLLKNKNHYEGRRKAVRVQGFAEEVVPSYWPSEFRSHFRLSVDTFEELVLDLGNCPEFPRGPQHGGRKPISIPKHLLITLWVLGNQEALRSVSDRFNVTKSSVFTCVNRVCEALKNNIANDAIAWPEQQRAKAIMEGFKKHRGLVGVYGAIDGCHIPIKAPLVCPENYINRKHFHSVNLTAICDHEMRFTYCYAGWPGSVHDVRVFSNSDLYRNVGDKFPDDTYLLGDAAYTLEKWMMVPFKDHGHLTQQQSRYNFIHSSTRMVIERAFALLKGRFRRLKYLDMSRITEIPTVILAACTLHNICLDTDDSYEDFMEDVEPEVNGYQSFITPGSDAVEKRAQIMERYCR